jgi:hypothetical protein
MALFNFLNPENHPKKIHNLLYGPSHLRGHLLRKQIKIFGVLKSLASSVPKAVIDSPLVIIFLKTYSSGFARSFEERCCDACIAIAEGKKVAKKRGVGGGGGGLRKWPIKFLKKKQKKKI